MKNLYESFVSARDREERGLSDREGLKPERPRQGNTVYVFGYGITEDILRSTFASNEKAKIVNVSMEVEKVGMAKTTASGLQGHHLWGELFQNCGFVTFDKAEGAEQAILDHNGTLAQGIQLKVRRNKGLVHIYAPETVARLGVNDALDPSCSAAPPPFHFRSPWPTDSP